MAATNYTPIQLYYSNTAAAVPVNTNLLSGELAINITDGKLYYKNNAGTVTLLSSAAGASGDVVGPASATDNALARFDLTTGKLIQNSVGILSDAGELTGLTSLNITGSGTTNPMYLGAGSTGISTYGLLTFNNITSYTGTIGMYGGGSTDPNLYLNTSTSAGFIKLRVAGNDRFSVSDYAATLENNANTSVGYTISNSNVASSASRSIFTATSGTVSTLLVSIGSSGIGYTGTASNHPFEIFTNGGTRINISAAGLVTLGTSPPTADATYNALTVGGTGIAIAPDGNAKLKIGRYSSVNTNSYFALNSTSIGYRWSGANDANDLMTLRSSDALLQLGLNATTLPATWNSSYSALSLGGDGSAVMGSYTNGNTYVIGNGSYNASGQWVATNNGGMISLFGAEGSGPAVYVTALATSAGQVLSPIEATKWSVNGDVTMAGSLTTSIGAFGRLTVASNTPTYASATDQAIWARNGTAAAGTIVAVNAATSGNNIIHDMYQGTTPARIGTIYYARGGDTIVYGTGNPTVSAPFNTAFTKYGVTFNSTSVQSSDPNTLDDYEEGLWYPSVSFGGTSALFTVQYGYYVKVGQQVTLTGYLLLNSYNGGSGNAVLTGLPFAVGNNSIYYSGFNFGYYSSATLPAGASGLFGYGQLNAKNIYIGYCTTATWTQANSGHLSSSLQLGPWTLTYITQE
jgi:hypothetical protein